METYSNYAGYGTGDGRNEVAIIDPFVGRADRYHPSVTVMAEVLRKLGPAAAGGGTPGVTEWCINTCAVDPATKAVLADSEDGYLYRRDLTTNTIGRSIRLTQGIFEAYTPAAQAASGAVPAIQNAALFCVPQ